MDERGLARVQLDTKGGLLTCSDAGKGLVTVDMGRARPGLEGDSPGRGSATPTIPVRRGRHAPSPPAPSRWAIPIASCLSAMPKRRRWRSWARGSKPMPLFPKRVNVEFAQVLDQDRIRMRVWERGVGITLACGTGACATAVAAIRRGPDRPQGGSGAGWRHADHGMARKRRPCADDRARRHAVSPAKWIWTSLMSVEVVTFGCRLNAYESEAIKAPRRRGAVARRRGGQHLRRDRRSGAPVAPGHPQAEARAARARASSSPAAPRRPSRKPMPPCRKWIRCWAMQKS